MTDVIPLEAQIAALRGSMAIMADEHAKALLREKENTQWWKKRSESYGLSADRWRERAEQAEARLDLQRPLVVLEFEDNEEVASFRDRLENWELELGDRYYTARFIAVLRPGKVDDDAG